MREQEKKKKKGISKTKLKFSSNNILSGNLLSLLLRCGSRPNERDT